MESVLALSHLQAESRRLPMDFRKSCIDSRLRGPAPALDNGDILALGAQGVAFCLLCLGQSVVNRLSFSSMTRGVATHRAGLRRSRAARA